MNFSEQNLKTIRDALASIDYTQPKAHECFRQISKQLMDLMTSTKLTWSEYYLISIGMNLEKAAAKYRTIPPPTKVRSSK